MIDLFKMEKRYSMILLVMTFFSICGILLLSVNTFYWADDYSYMSNLNERGIIGNSVYGYYNWDGRFLSLGAFFQGFCLHFLSIETTTLFWSLCFLISGVLTFFIIDCELDLVKCRLKYKFLIGSILSIVLWLGSYKHISETIYWGTGGIYSFSLLLGALWILFFLRFQKSGQGLFSKITFLAFSVVVGGTMQNLSIALVLLVLATMSVDFLKKQEKNPLFNGLVLIAVIAGLLFILFAPGNFLRMKAVNNIDYSDISILELFKNYFFVLIIYAKKSSALFVISVIAGIGIALLISPNFKLNKSKHFFMPKAKEVIIIVLDDLKWLLLALSTILPFTIIPTLASPRTSIFFMYFMLLFIVSTIIKLTRKQTVVEDTNHIVKSNVLLSYSLFTLVLSCSVFFTLYNFKKGLILKRAIKERETLMRNSVNDTIELKLIETSLKSPCYQFTDFPLHETKESAWIRESQQKYFHLKRIIVKE